MRLTSAGFEDGQEIPERHTCDGANVGPELEWSDLPPETQSLALRCNDRDAPGGTFTHWTVWDLDPGSHILPEGRVPPDARQGTNDFGMIGYGGPCPPRGSAPHRYSFRLYALRQPLDLDDGATPDRFNAAVHDHAIAHTDLIGLYARH
jgi:Raf kinase inhibitor-like YbhB/YbcL family protein